MSQRTLKGFRKYDPLPIDRKKLDHINVKGNNSNLESKIESGDDKSALEKNIC